MSNYYYYAPQTSCTTTFRPFQDDSAPEPITSTVTPLSGYWCVSSQAAADYTPASGLQRPFVMTSPPASEWCDFNVA